jgi:hypothetical protein
MEVDGYENPFRFCSSRVGIEPTTSFDLRRGRVGSPPNTVEPNTRCVVLIGGRRVTV